MPWAGDPVEESLYLKCLEGTPISLIIGNVRSFLHLSRPIDRKMRDARGNRLRSMAELACISAPPHLPGHHQCQQRRTVTRSYTRKPWPIETLHEAELAGARLCTIHYRLRPKKKSGTSPSEKPGEMVIPIRMWNGVLRVGAMLLRKAR